MKKLNILYISHYSELNGANLSLLNLIDTLVKENKILPIILIPEEGPLVEEVKRRNFKYYVIKFLSWEYQAEKFNKPRIFLLKHNLLNEIYYKNVLTILKKDKLKIDLIHSNSSVIDIGQYISSELSIPHIWHLREFGKEDYGLKYCISEKKVIRQYCKATKLIAISKSIQRYYENMIEGKEIELVYNGIPDTSYINNYNNEIVKICCVGLIHEKKNQMEILAAIKILRDENITNFRLYFIGSEDSEYREKMNGYVYKNNLEKYVEFMGRRENVFEILTTMDIGVMPSLKEAFGRVTVEYMLAGLLTIGSNTGGTKEIIVDNKTGYLYEIGNTRQLADILKKTINDKDMRVSMGKHSKNYALNTFGIKSTADKVFNLYIKSIGN